MRKEFQLFDIIFIHSCHCTCLENNNLQVKSWSRRKQQGWRLFGSPILHEGFAALKTCRVGIQSNDFHSSMPSLSPMLGFEAVGTPQPSDLSNKFRCSRSSLSFFATNSPILSIDTATMAIPVPILSLDHVRCMLHETEACISWCCNKFKKIQNSTLNTCSCSSKVGSDRSQQPQSSSLVQVSLRSEQRQYIGAKAALSGSILLLSWLVPRRTNGKNEMYVPMLAVKIERKDVRPDLA